MSRETYMKREKGTNEELYDAIYFSGFNDPLSMCIAVFQYYLCLKESESSNIKNAWLIWYKKWSEFFTNPFLMDISMLEMYSQYFREYPLTEKDLFLFFYYMLDKHFKYRKSITNFIRKASKLMTTFHSGGKKMNYADLTPNSMGKFLKDMGFNFKEGREHISKDGRFRIVEELVYLEYYSTDEYLLYKDEKYIGKRDNLYEIALLIWRMCG
jgi:hypothetical protein